MIIFNKELKLTINIDCVYIKNIQQYDTDELYLEFKTNCLLRQMYNCKNDIKIFVEELCLHKWYIYYNNIFYLIIGEINKINGNFICSKLSYYESGVIFRLKLKQVNNNTNYIRMLKLLNIVI